MSRGNELAERLLDGAERLMHRPTRFSTVRTVREGVAVVALVAASLIAGPEVMRAVIEETDPTYKGREYG
jgi:hypothetical protein